MESTGVGLSSIIEYTGVGKNERIPISNSLELSDYEKGVLSQCIRKFIDAQDNNTFEDFFGVPFVPVTRLYPLKATVESNEFNGAMHKLQYHDLLEIQFDGMTMEQFYTLKKKVMDRTLYIKAEN
jgi:hypothetical protein